MARKDVRESIADAIEWLAFTQEVWQKQRDREDEDLAFQSAEGAWPDDVIKQRGPVAAVGKLPALPGRPMLSVATLDEPVALVAAEERKAHLGVQIAALDTDADDDTSDILQGIYRTIERDSRAPNVRSWAYQRALWAGWGVYRVSKKYDPYGGHPFDQKLVLERILYQEHVILDAFARQPDWSDMRRAMVIDDMPWQDYKRKYRKSKVARAGVDGLTALNGNYPTWIGLGDGTAAKKSVRIAEEWWVEITERTYVLLDDGSVAPEDDIPEGREAVTGDEARSAVQEERRVFHRVINCQEELEPTTEWDGQYIPLIPAIGRELQPVKGKRQWNGMVANAKDAVRLTNYAASGAIEMAALEPRAPFELDPEQIEGYEDWWATSNIRNWPYLPHHRIVRGHDMGPPPRVQADVAKMGPSMQLLAMGRQFVQTATAIYPPALGENTPAHRSGRAISALQDQSLQANTPYLDNLANVSMQYEAMVILDLIPHIYDRPGRLLRIADADDPKKSTSVILNAPFMPHPTTGRPIALPMDTPDQEAITRGMVADPRHPAKHHDLSKGRYGVSVTVGKAKPTRNAEGSDALSALMQAEPQLVPLLGPEWARFQDFPGHDTVAALLTKFREHLMPWLDEPPGGAPDPKQLAVENAMLKQQLAMAAKTVEGKVIEQKGKLAVTRVQEQAETERARAANETKLAVAALESKVETLQNMLQIFFEERGRLGTQVHDAVQAGLDRGHDALMASGEHQAAMTQLQAAPLAAPTEPPGAAAAGPGGTVPAQPPGPADGNGAGG